MVFESPSDKSTFFAITAATSLAFFAMVGFEDSVNMAEECTGPDPRLPQDDAHRPRRHRRHLRPGLDHRGRAGARSATSPTPTRARRSTQVVAAGAPDLPFDKIFPFIGMFAVANSALINMLMASRLLYGMANQDVLPRTLGKVHPTRRTPWVAIIFTTLLVLRPDHLRRPRQRLGRRRSPTIALLGGTTALLLLCVFTVVNIALLVLRKQPVDHDHFRAPTVPARTSAPLTCAFLAGPWARAEQQSSTRSPAACWRSASCSGSLTWLTNRGVRAKKTGFRDIEHLEK